MLDAMLSDARCNVLTGRIALVQALGVVFGQKKGKSRGIPQEQYFLNNSLLKNMNIHFLKDHVGFSNPSWEKSQGVIFFFKVIFIFHSIVMQKLNFAI